MPKLTAAEAARLRVKHERMPFKKLQMKRVDAQQCAESHHKWELSHLQEQYAYYFDEPFFQNMRAQARQSELNERRQRVYWTARSALLEEVFNKRRLVEETREYVQNRRPRKIRPRRFRPQTKFWKRTRRA